MLGLAAALASTVAQAQFTPITLTPESFNYDIVVEKEATPPPARNTTATFDGGTNNTSNTFYELGFNRNPGAETSGIPASGSTVSNPTTEIEHTYTLPNYTAPNAFFIDSTVLNSTINLATPAPYTGLSLLATSGGGAGVLRYEIIFADDTREVGTANITVPDWYGGANPVIIANGRVDVVGRGFQSVNDPNQLNPRIYGVDIALTETTKAVKAIYLERVSGGRVGVFAVAGQSTAGGAFLPVPVTGYTYDMIVEAEGDQPVSLRSFTTATMDGGPNNNANTWYEVGYNTAAPTTGLPAAGSTITSAAFSDHTYKMPVTYAGNNALFINQAVPTGALVPVTPVNASALSFLAASANGTVTFNFTITHQDGSTQTGSIAVPDWFNGANAAHVTQGRVNVDNASFNAMNSGNPRIYSIDTPVNNTVSPITRIDTSWASGTGRTVIMALSATAGAVRPLYPVEPVSITRAVGGTGTLDVTVGGSAPFTYQWEKLVNGQWVPVQNSATISGATSEDLTFSNMTLADFGDYRLTASNVAGTTSSRAARVNVVSSRADLTIPGDTVLMVGGSTPPGDGENVVKAIDDTTAKYLNFGIDPAAAPFEGPVGLQLELIEPAVINGLRIYTANDAPERDPVGYVLQASRDPGAAPESFVTIASGSLNLPLERNPIAATPTAIDPLTLANQEIQIANAAGYQFYRLLFTSVRDNAAANSVQVAEVEFLGEYGQGAPSLNIARNNDGTITITTSQAGTLQATSSLNTPINWSEVGPIDGSVTLPTSGTMRFFRVVR